jgi:uncharacterized membrane protein YhaH (DUF805 family)
VKELLFSFKGRINRKAFITGWVFLLLLGLAFSFVLYSPAFVENDGEVGVLLFLPIQVFLVWTNLALQSKRNHDRGRSGWFCLLIFIPLVNLLYLLDLMLIKGVAGVNQYGPPLE